MYKVFDDVRMFLSEVLCRVVLCGMGRSHTLTTIGKEHSRSSRRPSKVAEGMSHTSETSGTNLQSLFHQNSRMLTHRKAQEYEIRFETTESYKCCPSFAQISGF